MMADIKDTNWEALQEFMSGGTDRIARVYYRGEKDMNDENFYIMHVCFKVYHDGQVVVIAADGNQAHVRAERERAEANNETSYIGEENKFFSAEVKLPVTEKQMRSLTDIDSNRDGHIELGADMTIKDEGIYPNRDELLSLFEAVQALCEEDERRRFTYGRGHEQNVPATFVNRLQNIIERLVS